ncbi:MAG: DUF3108 domain-containing protein [Burkholderiaceae bacterium]|nr:DUF3108 domain-containing protein [Burkholderiaceae bacterium]
MNDRRRVLATMPLALLGAGGLRPFAASAADPAPPSTASRVAPLPEPVTQSFQVYYGDMSRKLVVAEASYRLAHGDGRYELGTEGKAIGVVAIFYSGVLVQQSVGRVGPAGLVPERYRERRGKRPERGIRFDYARGLMLGNGEPAPEVPLLPGTQDRLSIFYQVGLMARARPRDFVAGRQFTVPLASMKTIDQPRFTVVGEEPVRTARGDVAALHLKVRNEDDPTDPVIDAWLAPAMSMLPARIRVEDEDGKVIDQVVVP